MSKIIKRNRIRDGQGKKEHELQRMVACKCKWLHIATDSAESMLASLELKQISITVIYHVGSFQPKKNNLYVHFAGQYSNRID